MYLKRKPLIRVCGFQCGDFLFDASKIGLMFKNRPRCGKVKEDRLLRQKSARGISGEYRKRERAVNAQARSPASR